MAETETSFKSRLRRLMREKGLSRRALAKEAHVSPSAVDKWLVGSRPRKWTLIPLCGRLQVDYKWLSEGIGQPYLEGTEVVIKSPRSLNEFHEETAKIEREHERAVAELKAKLDELESLRRLKTRLATEKLRAANESQEKMSLPDTHRRVFITVMPPLPTSTSELINRLRMRAVEMGGQKPMADALRAEGFQVSPQRLNDWLSGRVKPSGDKSLRLLAWVQAEEAKQKRESDDAGTCSKPKT